MSHSLDQAQQNAQNAASFFGRPGLPRLVNRLYEKYAEESQVRGQVILSDCTPTERREIASFLGKPLYAVTTIKVKLSDVERALMHSFNCTLPDMLRAYNPGRELVTRVEQRARHTDHQLRFRSKLAAITAQLPLDSQGKRWLESGLHGEQWLYARSKNASVEEQQSQLKLTAYVAGLLDQLPRPDAPERLALFAQRTSGDPHMLDSTRAAGRLFLLALADLANDKNHDEKGAALAVALDNSVGYREQELLLYRNAGLLVDTISSNVAVYNLADAYFRDGTPDPLLQAAGERVLLLPLRQLQEWQGAQSMHDDIYVVENPQVFEEIIAALQVESAPSTLVCTSGWPSVAALTLLDLLLRSSPHINLRYSGDFDAKGLQIAAYLLARYAGRCHPWRFDPDTYLSALQPGGIQAPSSDLALLNALPETFAPLLALMRAKGMWAYQEGITRLLIDDIQKDSN
ncbi:MAG TPA: TIGR02679 domain-containing protein [Ktedonobacteraceae bacterium]|nr:TIGR02679 domain-containing protein [Ktedonobacteraceae bacterium]